MDISCGAGGDSLGFGLWRIEVYAKRHHFSLRLPFFGSVAYFKQGSDLPYQFERTTWATLRQEARQRRSRITACWLALLVGNTEVARKIAGNDEEAEAWCSYYESIGIDLMS